MLWDFDKFHSRSMNLVSKILHYELCFVRGRSCWSVDEQHFVLRIFCMLETCPKKSCKQYIMQEGDVCCKSLETLLGWQLYSCALPQYIWYDFWKKIKFVFDCKLYRGNLFQTLLSQVTKFMCLICEWFTRKHIRNLWKELAMLCILDWKLLILKYSSKMYYYS